MLTVRKQLAVSKGVIAQGSKPAETPASPEAMARSTASAVMVRVLREATSGCLLCLGKARPEPPTQELTSGILTHLQLLLHSDPLSPFI